MKPKISFFGILLLYMPFYLSAQLAPSKWHWGISAGINTLWIPKEVEDIPVGIVEDNTKTTINRVGNRVGYQLMGNIRYQFNKRWGFVGGLGITKANSKTYRKIYHEGDFLGRPSKFITFDTIALKNLFLDVKVNARFQITNLNTSKSNINFYVDFEAFGELPLVNNASYSYIVAEREYSYSHGKLNVFPVAPFFAVGMIGKYFGLSLGFSNLIYNNSKDNFLCSVVLTRMMYNWYF